MTAENPKIRTVRPLPVIVGKEQMIALQDPHYLADKDNMVIMSSEAFFLVANLFNGENSISDIQTILTRAAGGVLFPRSQIEEIVNTLDSKYLLENENYRQKLEAYRKEPIRNSILAGRSLPDTREKMNEYFDKVMEQAPANFTGSPVRAFICPHIDIERANKSYAKSYHALQNGQDADLYVIFGTAHFAAANTRFAFTRKSYQTPYGILPTDEEFVRAVEKKVTAHSLFEDEIVHKGEHSAEFQVLFLQHTIAKKKPIRVVPILVGNFEDCMDSSPLQDPAISDVLAALSETASEYGEKKICWIASVDLSHVGLQFGDESAPGESLLKEIRAADMECLDAAGKCDPEGFFRSLGKHKNRFNVCGLSPIYTLLHMIENKSLTGTLLEYEQSLQQETGSVVTLASMIFTNEKRECFD